MGSGGYYLRGRRERRPQNSDPAPQPKAPIVVLGRGGVDPSLFGDGDDWEDDEPETVRPDHRVLLNESIVALGVLAVKLRNETEVRQSLELRVDQLQSEVVVLGTQIGEAMEWIRAIMRGEL